MAQAFGVRSYVNPCKISGGQSDTATGFSWSTSVFFRQYHSTSAPCSSWSLRFSYQDKRASLGNLPKSLAVSEVGKHRLESVE